LLAVNAEQGVEFPPRCVRCNTPTDAHWVEEKLWWAATLVQRMAMLLCPLVFVRPIALRVVPFTWLQKAAPWLLWTSGIFAAFVVGLALAMALGRWKKWRYVLCEVHWLEQRKQIKEMVFVASALVAILIATQWMGWWAPQIGVVALAAGISVAMSAGARRPGYAFRRGHRVLFKGCGEAFVASFPVWPEKP
jgi:hypothetical protein